MTWDPIAAEVASVDYRTLREGSRVVTTITTYALPGEVRDFVEFGSPLRIHATTYSDGRLIVSWEP